MAAFPGVKDSFFLCPVAPRTSATNTPALLPAMQCSCREHRPARFQTSELSTVRFLLGALALLAALTRRALADARDLLRIHWICGALRTRAESVALRTPPVLDALSRNVASRVQNPARALADVLETSLAEVYTTEPARHQHSRVDDFLLVERAQQALPAARFPVIIVALIHLLLSRLVRTIVSSAVLPMHERHFINERAGYLRDPLHAERGHAVVCCREHSVGGERSNGCGGLLGRGEGPHGGCLTCCPAPHQGHWPAAPGGLFSACHA
jgi:hypothetical protein